MKITELTAVTLGKKIKAKEITVAEAVSAVLEQIEAVEGDVHAYVTRKDKEKVLKKAEEIQAKIDAGELDGPLAASSVGNSLYSSVVFISITCSKICAASLIHPSQDRRTLPVPIPFRSLQTTEPFFSPNF